MIIQSEWRAIIIKKRVTDLIKMLAIAVCLICIYKIGNGRDSKSGTDERIISDTQYSDGSATTYDFSMGTSVVINLYGNDLENSDYSSELMERINYLDDELISWRNDSSELYEVNNKYKKDVPYGISDELYNVLDMSLAVCRDSEGALDISIRPLAKVWNIEEADSESFTIPTDKDIDKALEYVGYENITLEDGTVTMSKDNMILDLGSVGKGYALDVVRDYLEDTDVDGAVVSVGGSVLVYGSKASGKDWHIGIRNPKGDASDMIGYLTIQEGADICVSTSGDYEKYFMVDGKRYHHILDRNTGYPAYQGLSSVTVVCENGLYSDALSTACFSLGYEKSLALLEKYNAEAIFIDYDNNVTVTDGLKEMYSKSE